MGFFVRKGFNFGSLRVNFSKSGIGLSLGIKGIRIGSGSKGNYIHAGRKGVYYKKSLPNYENAGNLLQLNWIVIVTLLIVVAGIYFYLQADGDWEKIPDLFVRQFK